MHLQQQPVERPGCVTAYALILWLAAGAYIVAALSTAVISLTNPDSAFIGLFGAVCVSLFALIPILTGIGLWKMRLWSWWLVVILNAFGFLAGLLYLLAGVVLMTETADVLVFVCGAALGLALNGGILYWFTKNRALFAAVQTVTGPDGEIVHKSTSIDTGAIIAIVGIVAILCLIPIFAIAMLTLLGPQIGNVFSTITAGLEATP